MAENVLKQMRRKLSEAEGYLLLNLPARALAILEAHADWATMKYESCILQGEALRMMERWRDALRPLEQAALLRPGDLNASIALGWCYKRTHRLAQAIDALTFALNKAPKVALLHYNLACYWSLANDPDQALGYLVEALNLEPEYLEMTRNEPDFDPIRGLPQFERIVSDAAKTA